MSCGIAVMAKASAAGRTKTRLVPPLTYEEAAAFNSAFLQDVAANVVAASQAVPITAYMAFGPPGSEAFFKAHLPSVGLIESWHPNFGECLFGATEGVFCRGHDAAVVLNSDSPTLPTSLLIETAAQLARHGDRLVLGPSTDGGYYLLGLKAHHRRLFEDVSWSTDQVARQTLERAVEIGLEVHVLPAWYDVDDAQSLRVLWGEVCGGRSFTSGLRSHAAVHTHALIRSLCTDPGFARRLAGEEGTIAAAE